MPVAFLDKSCCSTRRVLPALDDLSKPGKLLHCLRFATAILYDDWMLILNPRPFLSIFPYPVHPVFLPTRFFMSGFSIMVTSIHDDFRNNIKVPTLETLTDDCLQAHGLRSKTDCFRLNHDLRQKTGSTG